MLHVLSLDGLGLILKAFQGQPLGQFVVPEFGVAEGVEYRPVWHKPDVPVVVYDVVLLYAHIDSVLHRTHVLLAQDIAPVEVDPWAEVIDILEGTHAAEVVRRKPKLHRADLPHVLPHVRLDVVADVWRKLSRVRQHILPDVVKHATRWQARLKA